MGNKKRNKEGKAMSRFGAWLLYYTCRIVGWLPFWFLYYVLAAVIYFILYYIVRYRVGVTRDNLGKAFPEKDKEELRRIERDYYRHLSEVFVDTIDLVGISPKALKKRITLVNEAEHRAETEGKDWVAATSHYGSWEYFMFYALDGEPERELLGVYRPLHNEVFDIFYKKMRSRLGMVPVSMNTVMRRIITDRGAGIPVTVGLIADQTPPWRDIDHWFDFFGRPTPFFTGMGKIATRFGMPVYFLHMEKTGRAHYRCRFEMIYDGKEDIDKYELTQRYAGRLEAMIRRSPEYWMWSHRRWKHRQVATGRETAEIDKTLS